MDRENAALQVQKVHAWQPRTSASRRATLMRSLRIRAVIAPTAATVASARSAFDIARRNGEEDIGVNEVSVASSRSNWSSSDRRPRGVDNHVVDARLLAFGGLHARLPLMQYQHAYPRAVERVNRGLMT